MTRILLSICVIFLLIPHLLISETHIGGDIEGGVWTLEGSPYIIEETVNIREGDSLLIEAGVWVVFDVDCGITSYNSIITAVGTPEDSIWFVAVDSSYGWRSFALGGMESSGRFEYCHFYGSWGWWEGGGAISNIFSPIVRNCTFRWCDSGIMMVGGEGGIIEDCLFDSMSVYGVEGNEGDYLTIRRCIFSNVSFRSAVSGTGRVSNCVFRNCVIGVFGMSTVNSIFKNLNYVFLRIPDTVSFNCIYRFGRLYELGDPPQGFGDIDRVNENGDSTDVYGNLFLDPLLVEGENEYPEYYNLQEESPCIDAGDPETVPDPDGTRADIGAFFFPQQNIYVEPEVIEFIDVQTGDRAEYELEIWNIGLLPLEISGIALRPDNTPFSIVEGEDVFEIPPDTSHTLVIGFAPEREDTYETTLLIMSNDRDQGELTIPITGNALDVASTSVSLPARFELSNPRPNPFNRSCRIDFSLPQRGFTTLELIDTQGRKVVELVSGFLSGGSHVKELRLDDCPAGVYLVRLRHEGRDAVRKVVYLR